MISTFIINLPQSVERKKNILEECDKVGLNPEIFEAYDGRKIMTHLEQYPELKNKILQQKEITLNLGLGMHSKMQDPLTYAEIGCALSHLKVYEEIVRRNLEYALILEDDIAFEKDFSLVLDPIVNMKDKWDTVLISHASGIRDLFINHKYFLAKGESGDIFLKREGMGILDPIFNRRRMAFIASCYFINKKACERLIDIGYPIRLPADYLLGYPALHGLRMFSVRAEKFLAYAKTETFESTISDRPRHKLI